MGLGLMGRRATRLLCYQHLPFRGASERHNPLLTKTPLTIDVGHPSGTRTPVDKPLPLSPPSTAVRDGEFIQTSLSGLPIRWFRPAEVISVSQKAPGCGSTGRCTTFPPLVLAKAIRSSFLDGPSTSTS